MLVKGKDATTNTIYNVELCFKRSKDVLMLKEQTFPVSEETAFTFKHFNLKPANTFISIFVDLTQPLLDVEALHLSTVARDSVLICVVWFSDAHETNRAEHIDRDE